MSRARRIGLPLLNFCQSTSCVPSQVGGSYPTPSFPGPSGTRTWSQWRHTKIQHYDILHLYLHLIVLSPLPSSISREEDWTYPFQINKISPVYKRSKVFTSMLGLISTVMCVGFQLLVALAVPKPHWKLSFPGLQFCFSPSLNFQIRHCHSRPPRVHLSHRIYAKYRINSPIDWFGGAVPFNPVGSLMRWLNRQVQVYSSLVSKIIAKV